MPTEEKKWPDEERRPKLGKFDDKLAQVTVNGQLCSYSFLNTITQESPHGWWFRVDRLANGKLSISVDKRGCVPEA